MTIEIPRFETKKVDTGKDIRMQTPFSVAIKDHLTDDLIALVSFYKTHEKNEALAEKIIELIESEINEG